jgi:hypothetical protein
MVNYKLPPACLPRTSAGSINAMKGNFSYLHFDFNNLQKVVSAGAIFDGLTKRQMVMVSTRFVCL